MLPRSVRVLVSLCALTALPATALAEAPPPERRKGFELFAGGGMNNCKSDGDAKCESGDKEIGSSATLLVAPGLRVSPNIGIYLDLAYGWLDPPDTGTDADVTMTTMVAMPTFRLYAPMRTADLFAGVGIGYTKLEIKASQEGEEMSIWRTNMSDLKLTGGGAFYVGPTMALGIFVDWVILVNGKGEVCKEGDGDKECRDMEGDTDVADLLQVGGFLRLSFE